MDLKKEYDGVDRKALLGMLRINGVGGWLLKAEKSLIRNGGACVEDEGERKGML